MQRPQPVELTILVVSYNTRALTLAALDSIAAETRQTRYRVRVVDNASSDGSAEALRNHPTAPDVIASAENLGFARANNRAALGVDSDYILLLNPDTIVRDGAIDRLMEFARFAPEAGIWGGRTLFADGQLNPSSCWGRMTPWNLLCRATGLTGLLPRVALFNGEAYGGWQRDHSAPVDIVSGCFLLIKLELWERLGGFDPIFFMYGEEADLCLRARRHGARPMITPHATIIHYGGASEPARAAKMVRLLAAKTTLIRRYWHPLMRPVGYALMAAWPLTRVLALTVANRLGPSPERRNAAATWWEVWQKRAVWLPGYATPAAAPHQVLEAVTP